MSSLHTSPHLQIGQLSRLGLDRARLGKPVKLKQSKRRASRRFELDDEPGFDSGLFPPGSRPAIAVGDLFVQSCSSNRDHVFAVTAPAGEELGIATTSDDSAWAETATLPGTVYIEPQADSAMTIVQPDGRGLLVVHERGKGVYAYDIEGAEDFAAATRASAEAMQPDFLLRAEPQWVQFALIERLAQGRPYDLVVAAGLHARFSEPVAAEATATISRLLAGLPDPEQTEHHSWFAQQTVEFRRITRSAAMSHCHALADLLDAIESRCAEGEPPAATVLRSAAEARDDLACARVVLQATGDAEELSRALYAVDTKGRKLRDAGLAFAVEASLRDESIELLDPDAWWTGGVPESA